MAPPSSAYHAQQGRRRRRAAPHLGGSVLRTASVALAAYGTYRLAAWAYNSWMGNGEDDRLREEEHFVDGDGGRDVSVSRRSREEETGERAERCRAETLRAVEDFLPSLRKAVEGRTDCAAEGRELKHIRRRRRQKREEETKPPPQARGDGDGDGDGDGSSPPSEQRHREKRDKDGGSHDRGERDAGDGGNKADEGGVVEYEDDEEEEKRLWEVIKVCSITRLVSTAYAHAALLCLLTVQVHVMGRMLLEDEEGASGGGRCPGDEESSAEEMMGQYHKSHRLVLTRTFQHFFSDEGVGSLVRAVEEAVRNRLSAWNMTDPKLALCEEEFAAGLDAVRWSFESDRDDDAAWGEFLVPDPAIAADDGEQRLPRDGGGEERARLVLDETWDAVESPLFAAALRECVEGTFNVMRREYWGKTLFSSKSLRGEEISVANGDTNGNGPSVRRRGGSRRVPQPRLPLATIVTQLKHSSNSVYCTNGGEPWCGDSTVGARHPNGASHSENMYLSVSFMTCCPSLMELGDASFYDNEQI